MLLYIYISIYKCPSVRQLCTLAGQVRAAQEVEVTRGTRRAGCWGVGVYVCVGVFVCV